MAKLIFTEESSAPATPSTNNWSLYFKSGGLYFKDDAGTETGPLSAGGSVADADYGDIVVSSSGTAWTIDSGAVSLSKMANMATASLLGRNTAGTGAPEVLSASTVRTLLALVPGTDVQAYDAELAALAGLTSAADKFPYFTGSGTASLLTIVSAIRTILASADASTFRSNAGLAIGTNVQAWDADLDTWATKTAPSGTVVGHTDTQTLSAKTLTKPVINGSDPTAATYSPASGSQTVTLDCSANNIHFVQGNNSGTAITFAISNITNNQVIMVSVTQGSTTLSTIAGWFSTIRWAGGAAPTFTATLNKRDVFGFIRTGSGTYDGFVIGQNI